MPSPAELEVELTGLLAAAANKTGGWGYYAGKASRIEPTCWAMLALASQGSGSTAGGAAHQRFLTGCQRSDGLLSDRSDLPANASWSALAYLTLSAPSASFAPGEFNKRLLDALVETTGVQLGSSPVLRQNNKLKGWPWTPETFSWTEPTSWCLLALKRAARASSRAPSDAVAQRIAEGEALLIDRVCYSGGWNYGNSNVFGKNLPAHVPTTALGLVALQDRRDIHAGQRSLAFLEEHWRKELSGTALGLSLICLRIYGRRTEEIETAIIQQWQRTRFLGNLATTAMACCALSMNRGAVAALALPS